MFNRNTFQTITNMSIECRVNAWMVVYYSFIFCDRPWKCTPVKHKHNYSYICTMCHVFSIMYSPELEGIYYLSHRIIHTSNLYICFAVHTRSSRNHIPMFLANELTSPSADEQFWSVEVGRRHLHHQRVRGCVCVCRVRVRECMHPSVNSWSSYSIVCA